MRTRILAFFVMLCFYANAQDDSRLQVDSLIRATEAQPDDTVKCLHYNRISNLYLYTNSEKGLLYANKEIDLATRLNWEKGMGTGYLDMAKHLIAAGDYRQALKDIEIAGDIFSRTNDRYNLGNTHNQLGILKANQSKFPEALDYFFRAVKDYEGLKTAKARLNRAYAFQNIANIYTATETYEKAIQNYEEAIRLFEENGGDGVAIAMNIASKGLVYQKQHKDREALEAFKAAEKIILIKQALGNLAFIQSWIGSAYLALGEYDLSLDYSAKTMEATKHKGDEVLMASTIQNIGYAYLKKGMLHHNEKDLLTGFENLNKSLAMDQRLQNIELLIKDYLYLSEYYAFRKDYKSSLEAYKNYALYNDSIYNSKNKQSLQNLQDERTIEIRDKEIEVNKINLETKEKQKWFLLAATGLLLIIGGLLFYQNRSRKKSNEQLQALNAELDLANKTKTRFFTILNHDLRSPVSNLIHFLHLRNDSPELLTEEKKKEMEHKVVVAAENLLVSMEDLLLWSKGQMTHFKPSPRPIAIDQLFEDLKNHFQSSEHVRILFDSRSDVSLATDPDYLKTIMRNLTGNAIKALENTTEARIVWKAWQEAGHARLSISDNGPGGSEQQFKALYDDTEVVGIKTGLGLHLIRDLARAIGCHISVERLTGKGVKIILIFDQDPARNHNKT